ncbi:MAG: hypothetical protein AAF517_11980 [Planctomycetota bacterium]
MQVTIQHIESTQSLSVPGTAQLGYITEFVTPNVKGRATLVPGNGSPDSITPGAVIEVDVKQDYISRFRKLDDQQIQLKIDPLGDGEFSVQGKVIFSFDDGDFGVDVGGFVFTLDDDDALGRRPEIDDWVSFEVHGMSLWEKTF